MTQGEKRGCGPFLLGFACLCALALGGTFYPGTAAAIQLGRLGVTPRVELEGVYDDNLFLRDEQDPEGPIQDDILGRIRPGVAFAYDYGPTDLALRYRSEFLFYREHSENNNYGRNHEVTLTLGRDLRRAGTLTADDFLQIGTEVSEISAAGFEDVERVGLLPRQRDYRRNRASLEWAIPATRRLQIIPGAEYRYNWYGEVVRAGVVEETPIEEHHPGAHLGGSFQWHPSHAADLTLGFTYSDYERRGEARIYAASVGDTWRPTASLTLHGLGGVQYLDERRTLESGSTVTDYAVESMQPYGMLDLLYDYQDWSLTLTGYYGLRDSAGLETTVVSKSIRGSVSYRPTVRLSLSGFAYYSRDDSSAEETSRGQGMRVKSIQAGGRAEYELLSWLSAHLQYNYIRQKSDQGSGLSYRDNRVILGCVVSWPESIR